jgi:hypothetical protein
MELNSFLGAEYQEGNMADESVSIEHKSIVNENNIISNRV